MASLKAGIKLVRPSNCIYAGIGVLIGALIGLGGIPPLRIGFAFIAGALICGGGNAINDYYDRNLDKINKPKRPIPSGKIPPSTAQKIAGILFGVGIISAVLTGKIACVLLGGFNSGLLVYYSKSLKQKGLIGNLVIGYLVGSTFLFGSLAVGDIRVVGFMAAMAGFSTAGRELIKDIEDVYGDKETDSQSFPIKYGKEKAATLAIIFTSIAVFISPIPYLLDILGTLYLGVVFTSLMIFTAGALIIAQSQDPGEAARASFHYKIAMGFGLLAFLAGAFF